MVLISSETPPRPAEPPADAAGPGPWSASWSQRQSLLERQHQILSDRIAAQILAANAGAGDPQALAEHGRRSRQLLWKLRLHLRLEERWLAACGCLCPGHRASHQLVVQQAEAGLNKAATDPQRQLNWLRVLQAWLLEHTGGPDAHAYGQARSLSHCQP